MPNELILFDEHPDVSTITLNRPGVYNAVNFETLQHLDEILGRLELEPPRVVVLTGAGSGFCGGVDLKESREATSEFARRRVTLMHNVLTRLRSFPAPVITAIHGIAAGLGCELAISGDLRIATPLARFGYPEPRVAVPSPGYHLTRLIGLARAQDMLLTARWIEGTEAHAWGLATMLADDPMSAAANLAGDLLRLSPLSLRRTKENMRIGLESGAAAATAHHIDFVAAAADTADRKEALAAFAEKREPRFTGR